MTEEKINKGTELLSKLRSLKEDRKIWENGATLQCLTMSDKYDHIDQSSLHRARCAYVDFAKLREDTLANIDRMIKEIQKEFDKL